MSREIRLAIYFLLGLLLGGFAAAAKADYPAVKLWSYGQPTAAASASAAFAAWDASNPNNTVCAQGALVEQELSATKQYRIIGSGGQCNVPSTTTWSILNLSASWTCPDGGVYSGGVCHVTPNCASGSSATYSWFSGKFRIDGVYQEAGNYVWPPPPTSCSDSCQVAPNLAAPVTSCSVTSMVGTYPVFCHMPGTLTGQECTAGDSAALTAPSDPCPAGFAIGSVNGKSGCYPTGADPATTTTTSSTQGDVTTTVQTTVNPTTNTTTTTTTTTNNVTNTSTTQVTNAPTNPGLPMTNPGTSLQGSNKGTSTPGAAAGNPTNSPDQNPTCGWPGGPPCKIDESGTPTDGALTTQKTDYETKSTERKNQIDSLGLQGDHGMVWDWVFPMPSGGCSALSYGAAGHYFSIDPCENLGLVRDLLGFILYIGTALMLLSIATQTNTGGK